MRFAISGRVISHSSCRNIAVCIINDFSDNLKNLLRKNLAAICVGEEQFADLPEDLDYYFAVGRFLEIYDEKTEEQQKGMVGELLAHLLIAGELMPFSVLSPFFNLEEKSASKGFDIIYLDAQKEIVVTEVKSGSALRGQAGKRAKELLGTSRADMTAKLKKGVQNPWYNALSKLTLKPGDLKQHVKGIYGKRISESKHDGVKASEINVVLTAVVYSDPTSPLALSMLEDQRRKLLAKGYFASIYLVAIQKNTFEKIVDFLRLEAHGKRT